MNNPCLLIVEDEAIVVADQLHPRFKCLFLSGYTANVIAQHGVLDEGMHFIQKPFSMEDLAIKVRSVLDAASAA